jgi:hypothetical protein
MPSKKPRIVIDEDLLGTDLTTIKKKVKLTTSVELMGRLGAEDVELYEKCSSKDMHIITANVPHFRAIQRSHPQFKTGIIGIVGTSIDKSVKNFSNLISKEMPDHNQYLKKCVEVSSKSVKIRSASSSFNKNLKK